jgi:UDPglucose 6-dehydrogenase
MSTKIGFIGQGWIGRNYANDFEGRGYPVVRYSLEKEYAHNKDLIQHCDIVFIAVPTPTTKDGFDSSIVEKALALLGKGKSAVIKSTILPGTTKKMQEKFPHLYVFHSPEFLREMHAAHDASFPKRNIIGTPSESDEHRERAKLVLSVLPNAPFSKVMSSTEAELVKYIGNCFLYEKVVFFNQMYDLVLSFGLDYNQVREAIIHDDRIGESHTIVAHASGHNQHVLGRGAGGHCFIKDYEALIEIYEKQLPEDAHGHASLHATKKKNYDLLINSGKDLDLLSGVIGDSSIYAKNKTTAQ